MTVSGGLSSRSNLYTSVDLSHNLQVAEYRRIDFQICSNHEGLALSSRKDPIMESPTEASVGPS